MSTFDDATLHEMLDVLSAPAVPRAHSPSRFISAPSLHAATPVFLREDLIDAVDMVNSMLSSSGSGSQVQTLKNASAAAAHDTLASTLAILVKVIQSRDSNAHLRAEAEKAQKQSVAERDHAQDVVVKVKKSLAQKEAELLALQNKLDETDRTQKLCTKRFAEDIDESQSKLLALTRRETALSLEIKRKDNEFGKLQERVHMLLANRNAIMLPKVSLTPFFYDVAAQLETEELDCVSETSSLPDDQDYSSIVVSAYEQRQNVLYAENEVFRNLFRVVHDELCDLVTAVKESSTFTRRDAADLRVHEAREACPLKQDEDDIPSSSQEYSDNAPEDLLSCQQMELPLDAMRSVVEESLERKFSWLRRHLLDLPTAE